MTLFPGGWGLLGRGSQLKFRGFQGRGRGWDQVSGARGPVCRSSSHPVSNGAAAPCSCPRGADERMVSPRPLATRTEAASKQEAMSPGLVASHLVKEKKAGVAWSVRSKFSLRAVSHREPWRILSRVGAMVSSLHHRGKLEGRGWARLSTILSPCPEQGTHVSAEQQCPLPRALDLQTLHGRVRKTHRLSEEEHSLSLEVC